MNSDSMFNEFLQFISTNGFAIVVASFLLLRTEKKMDELTQAIKELIASK